MPDEYTSLVAAYKALTKGEAPNTETLKVAEDGWETRPKTVSYGIIQLDFEADALRGDNQKQITAYEGSMDLYSRKKDGDGWLPLIRNMLEEHCEGSWNLNYHGYERESKLYHWEWVYQVMG